MANQNLSQFTEKLFVADADHTFIWDTANAISKRVSRNSWLNSGTLTSDAPVTISQTWNNAAVAFTGLKFNAVSTASAAASLLLDLQVGGVSKFNVYKDGAVTIGTGGIKDYGSGQLGIGGSGATLLYVSNAAVQTTSAFSIGASFGVPTVFITRDADNTLALRNGAAAQTFNVYGTYTSGTSYERLTLSAPSAANAIIGTNKGSGGGTARGLDLHTDGAARMTITTAGNVGIGTTAPRTKLHLEDTVSPFQIEVSGSTIPNFTGVGFSPTLGNNTNLRVSPINAAWGGTSISAFGANQNSVPVFNFEGHHGSTSPTTPVFAFFSYKHNGSTGRTALAASEISYQFSNASTQLLTLLGSGNVGIGTTSPTSKLQVTGGDVEIETVTSGIIMKAAGTSTRYRITLNATGDALVFTAI